MDFVSQESKRAGKGAAKYIKKELIQKKDGIKTSPGRGVITSYSIHYTKLYEKSRSKALAFFNLLKTLIPSDIKNQSLDYKFSLDDLEEKVEMDKKIISSLIENLEHDGFINILHETSSEVNLHFERTYDKLIEVFSVEGIEDTIERMQDFVQKKIDYFDIDKIPVPLEKRNNFV